MASPVSSQPFAFGQEFEVVATHLVQTSALEAPERSIGDKAPTAVHLTDPIAPRSEVAYPAATSVGFTTAGISQELRSVALQGNTLVIFVPAYLKQRPPLSSLFDSLRKFVEEEKQQEVIRLAKQKTKLLSAKYCQDKKPQQTPQQACKHHQHTSAQHPHQQTTSQYPSTQPESDFSYWINKSYSFTRESIPKIFKALQKRADFQLPPLVKSDKVIRTTGTRYCPYHRVASHLLEDCIAFKEWLEKGYKEGSVLIPEEYLVDSCMGSAKVVFDLTDGVSDSSDD